MWDEFPSNMFLNSSIYSEVARSLRAACNFRKAKLFPRVNAVTLVTYYADGFAQERRKHFIGRAHTFHFWSLSKMTIELEHTSHLPPPVAVTLDEEEEIELDTEDADPNPFPAIGAQYVLAY